MKYIRLYEERLKDFEIMVMFSEDLIEELKKEIEKEDYDLGYIRDLVNWGHFDIDEFWIRGKGLVKWNFIVLASVLNKPEIIKVLLEEGGADPNLQNSDGFTALMKASYHGLLQVVQLLLSHPSIDPNLQDRWGGYTALIWASLRGYSQVVQELLKHPNIDPNGQTLNGGTALHWASEYGRLQVVKALLNHPKTDKTITDIEGKTAWDRAKWQIRDEFPELNPEVE